MKRSFQVAPEEEHDVRSFKNDLLTIDFDKVQAIGDIMLINPRDMKKVRHEPPVSEAISPNQQSQIPKNKVSLKHKQNLKNSKVNFSSFFIYFFYLFLYFLIKLFFFCCDFMKVGIIGCGAIANIIASTIVPEDNNIDIEYFYDNDVERAENLASFC